MSNRQALIIGYVSSGFTPEQSEILADQYLFNPSPNVYGEGVSECIAKFKSVLHEGDDTMTVLVEQDTADELLSEELNYEEVMAEAYTEE